MVASSLQEAIESLSTEEMKRTVDQIFVIGGESIYREAIQSRNCERIRLTSVETDVADCDTFFPPISALSFRMISRSAAMNEGGITYRFTELERIAEDAVFEQRAVGSPSSNDEELQYLHLIDDIIKNGVVKGDRTGSSLITC